MRPQTVSEVITKLQELEKQGYGDHILLVSDDEECNGYHELYGQSDGDGGEFHYYDDRKGYCTSSPSILFN